MTRASHEWGAAARMQQQQWISAFVLVVCVADAWATLPSYVAVNCPKDASSSLSLIIDRAALNAEKGKDFNNLPVYGTVKAGESTSPSNECPVPTESTTSWRFDFAGVSDSRGVPACKQVKQDPTDPTSFSLTVYLNLLADQKSPEDVMLPIVCSRRLTTTPSAEPRSVVTTPSSAASLLPFTLVVLLPVLRLFV